MTETTTLDRNQTAALAALADSPAARAALQDRENLRAAQRAAILDELAAAEPPAVAAAAAAGNAELAALIRVNEARQALRVAQVSLHQAGLHSQILTEALERLRNSAGVRLRALGGDRVDATHRAVLHEARRCRSALEWLPRRDRFGETQEFDGPTPAALARLKHLEALGVELQTLLAAAVTPAEIEARCLAVETWVASNAAPPEPTERSRWAGWFRAGHQRTFGGWKTA